MIDEKEHLRPTLNEFEAYVDTELEPVCLSPLFICSSKCLQEGWHRR